MWVLLQFISGSIQKNPTADFVPVLRLYSMYSSDTEPRPVPDLSHPSCVEQFAATAIFIHLKKKAVGENLRFAYKLPASLQKHHEFLMAVSKSPCSLNVKELSYNVPLLCNTFSTNQELFQPPMSALVEAVGGSALSAHSNSSMSAQPVAMPGINCIAGKITLFL